MTAGTDAPAVLQTEGLAKSYGTVAAVRDVRLSVRKGEIFGFLGPNGAGKTTTILMLLGIEKPSSGTIEMFGKRAPFDPYTVKRRLGVVCEHQYMYDDMSAWEYLQFFGALNRVPRFEARAQELLERLHLWEFRRLRARDHSRGMQQKLGLARALLHKPEFLILDEPVSGLDPHGIRQVREILSDENKRGVTIFISSHILSEVERTADRVGILFGGRLIAEDTVERIGARLRPDGVLELLIEGFTPRLLGALEAAPFVRKVVSQSDRTDVTRTHLAVHTTPGEDQRRAVSAIVTGNEGLIIEMAQARVSLEEAFVQLTAEAITSAYPAGSDPVDITIPLTPIAAEIKPPQVPAPTKPTRRRNRPTR